MYTATKPMKLEKNVMPKLSASTLAEWLLHCLETADTMPEAKRNAKMTVVEIGNTTATADEIRAGETLEKAVNSWLETHPMDFKSFAELVDVSTAAIYNAFKFVRREARKRGSANKVCATIGIEPSPLFDGKIVKAKNAPAGETANHRHRVMALAKKIASTGKAEQAAKMLEELLSSN